MPSRFTAPARQMRGARRTATAAALATGLTLAISVPSYSASSAAPGLGGPHAEPRQQFTDSPAVSSYPAPGQPLTTPSPSAAEPTTTVEKPEDALRVATLHADLVADGEEGQTAEQLVSALSTGNHVQARVMARTVQMNDPDVLVLTGVTYDDAEMVAEYLRSLYLSSGQDGLTGLSYPHVFTAGTNSGRESGADLDGDGIIGGPGDAIGYGDYPGQYGMIVFSKYPIVDDEVRTFQNFLWRDVPEGSMPDGYSELETSILRLQESSFWDVPIRLPGQSSPVNVIATSVTSQQPTEAESARAEDIRRVISDYVSGSAWYLTDDAGGSGGLTSPARAIVAGAPIATAAESAENLSALMDSTQLQDPRPEAVTEEPVSQRPGTAGQSDETATRQVSDTADTRASLVLPGTAFHVSDSGVFWPGEDEYGFGVVDPSSAYSLQDRLVWVDLTFAG